MHRAKRRNIRHTEWNSYTRDLKVELGDTKGKLNSVLDIEFEADRIGRAVLTAWTSNCPEKRSIGKKDPWWTSELERLRQETRRVFNEAKFKKDFGEYSRALTHFNTEVRKAKLRSWRTQCQTTNTVPEGMRLSKALSSCK